MIHQFCLLNKRGAVTKFQNKYRIESHRHPYWDYSANGSYYITLVTKHRVCSLGEIIDGEMVLSDYGNNVYDEWMKSFDIRDELFLDIWVIMPNHIHAIVTIKNNHIPVETHGRVSLPEYDYHQIDAIKRNQSIRLPKFNIVDYCRV